MRVEVAQKEAEPGELVDRFGKRLAFVDDDAARCPANGAPPALVPGGAGRLHELDRGAHVSGDDHEEPAEDRGCPGRARGHAPADDVVGCATSRHQRHGNGGDEGEVVADPGGDPGDAAEGAVDEIAEVVVVDGFTGHPGVVRRNDVGAVARGHEHHVHRLFGVGELGREPAQERVGRKGEQRDPFHDQQGADPVAFDPLAFPGVAPADRRPDSERDPDAP